MQLTYKKIMRIKELLTTSNWLVLAKSSSELAVDEGLTKLESTANDKADSGKIYETPKLGVAPFDGDDGKELARIILKNIHLLEIREFGIIQEVAAAIKEMLRENVIELVNDEGIQYAIHKYLENFMSRNHYGLVNTLLSGEKIELEKVFPLSKVSIERNKVLQNMVDHFNIANVNILSEIAPVLKFIAQFYMSGDIWWEGNSILLSLFFGSFEDIVHYLDKEVDFTNEQTFSRTITNFVFGNISIIGITKEEISIWHQITAKFGRDGIMWFSVAAKMNQFFNIKKLVELTDNDELLAKILKKTTMWLSYERLKEAPEFAQLCFKYKIEEVIFNRAVDEIIPKQKYSDLMPNLKVKFKIGDQEYYLSKSQPGALDILFVGSMGLKYYYKETLGKNFEHMVVNAFTREDACYYIFNDNNGKIKSGLYCWLGVNANDEKVLVINNNYNSREKAHYTKILGKYLLEEIISTDIKDICINIDNTFSSQFEDIKPFDDNLFRKKKEIKESKFVKLIQEMIPKLQNSNEEVDTFKNYKTNKFKFTPNITKFNFDKYVVNHSETIRVKVEQIYGEELFITNMDMNSSIRILLAMRKLVEEKICTAKDLLNLVKEHNFASTHAGTDFTLEHYQKGINMIIASATKYNVKSLDVAEKIISFIYAFYNKNPHYDYYNNSSQSVFDYDAYVYKEALNDKVSQIGDVEQYIDEQ